MVVLVSVSTRERLELRTALPSDGGLKSTNTLALLRATWKEGQILSPARAAEIGNLIEMNTKVSSLVGQILFRLNQNTY